MCHPSFNNNINYDDDDDDDEEEKEIKKIGIQSFLLPSNPQYYFFLTTFARQPYLISILEIIIIIMF